MCTQVAAMSLLTCVTLCVSSLAYSVNSLSACALVLSTWPCHCCSSFANSWRAEVNRQNDTPKPTVKLKWSPIPPSVRRFVSSAPPPCTWSPPRTPSSHWPAWSDDSPLSWRPANRWSPAACCEAASSGLRVWSESPPSGSEACRLRWQWRKIVSI